MGGSRGYGTFKGGVVGEGSLLGRLWSYGGSINVFVANNGLIRNTIPTKSNKISEFIDVMFQLWMITNGKNKTSIYRTYYYTLFNQYNI